MNKATASLLGATLLATAACDDSSPSRNPATAPAGMSGKADDATPSDDSSPIEGSLIVRALNCPRSGATDNIIDRDCIEDELETDAIAYGFDDEVWDLLDSSLLFCTAVASEAVEKPRFHTECATERAWNLIGAVQAARNGELSVYEPYGDESNWKRSRECDRRAREFGRLSGPALTDEESGRIEHIAECFRRQTTDWVEYAGEAVPNRREHYERSHDRISEQSDALCAALHDAPALRDVCAAQVVSFMGEAIFQGFE